MLVEAGFESIETQEPRRTYHACQEFPFWLVTMTGPQSLGSRDPSTGFDTNSKRKGLTFDQAFDF